MNDPLPLVLVTRALPDGWLGALDGRCTMIVGDADTPGLDPPLLDALPRAEGILCLLTERIDADLLDRAPQLRVVSTMAVGVDNIDVAACTARGIPVGHTPGVLTEATADLAMALLLATARRLPQAAADVREGRWSTWSPTGWLGADLCGATLGIVGLGKIGAALARRAHGFGLALCHASPSPRPELEAALGIRHVPLPELLACSDFVSLHVPLTEHTHRLIDARALARMKPTALLVNTARGPIVDPGALAEALHAGTIAGAALDVTDPEPLPPTHPLLTCPNLIVLPHIGSATWGTRRRMAELAANNLLAGLEGRRLLHPVDPTMAIRPRP
ncbi:2-hydroxyacid dehydrogenase [Paraliomyxa miuraensis]|uniref:2-hydroxyacid dehydrogenase n=1 Tax=Paraliomyxa miuraensis TaxID=376150 RepID=UPI00224EE363|nr:D-glycerate dehydrogenase [Paraliomyxa miuraensis]MCX4242987.1 D-glycerate dehydrogenase [Paraliomyxa miuraensis]